MSVRTTATELAWRQGKLDEYARVLVLIAPFPDRLVESLRNAEGVHADPWRHLLLRRYGIHRCHPDEMDERMRRVLELFCRGLDAREVAREVHYSLETVKELSKVLLALFGARNRIHLCALAIERGYAG